MRYAKHFQTQKTPQSEPIPGKSQVVNDAGGYVFEVDDWVRLDRFLILGSEGGTYYVGEHEFTKDNAQAVLRCIQADGQRVVNRTVEISEEGRAPKNDAAIFVLAMAAGMGDDKTKKAALDALPQVCRIGTHIFQFADAVESFRGWGRSLRRAVARWYTDKEVERLAYQIVKYRQRYGWTHRDLLRLAHPKAIDPALNALFHWVTQHESTEDLPETIKVFEALQKARNPKETIRIINNHPWVTWEMVPGDVINSPDVWQALVPNMPLTALIRNLGRMTANGALKPLSSVTSKVIEKVSDEAALRRARVHPIGVLAALTTYKSGQGARGKLRWAPIASIVDALDGAFYMAFGNVEPTNKRIMLALDVSGSMGAAGVSGIPNLTPRGASAAMALVTQRVELNSIVTAFASGPSNWWEDSLLVPVSISSRQRLDDVIRQIEDIPWGGTDCALPMLSALKDGLEIDAFVIYTDNETWAGDIHPCQALQKYRRETGIPAKLIVVAMTSTGFSIADPNDAGMLDVVGFDMATPNLISDFIRA